MFYRLRYTVAHRWFKFQVRELLQTPPLRLEDGAGSATLVTQICHRDISLYILSVKSFCRFVRPRSIIAIDDGSLTPDDLKILLVHIPDLRLLAISDFGSKWCPRGGAWERLLFIAEEVQRNYVIQLDADTLTLHDPLEVRAAISDGSSFALGTSTGQSVISAQEAAKTAEARCLSTSGPHHIQLVAERSFNQLSDLGGRRYVRANAGFAGFSPRSFTREDVERFSTEMGDLLGGSRWSEWGSEQVTSNYILANSENTIVLPYPAYMTFRPDCDTNLCAFIHFIGTYRFSKGTYSFLAKSVVSQIAKH